MGTYVNEQIAEAARNNGARIGKTEPSRETKGSWWEVYFTNRTLIACVMVDKDRAECGESLPASELHLYVDDIDAARKELKTLESSMLAERSKP